MTHIKLGERYRDRVSGLEGIAVCETRYMNNCVRIGLQPPVDKNGKMPDWAYLDYEQLERVDAGIWTDPARTAPQQLSDASVGGPQRSDPPRG